MNTINKTYEETPLLMAIFKSYGLENCVGTLANFQGGYINFGYWKNIPLEDNKLVSVDQRIQSSEHLYQYVADRLHISPEDTLLDIGCGQGVGSLFLANRYNPKKMIGIDITSEQITRAQSLLNSPLSKNCLIEFHQGSAQSTGLHDSSIDKALSIEAVQHFPCIKDFCDEMHRILKTKGQLAFAAHLATNQHSFDAMHANNLFVEEGIDNCIPVETVIDDLCESGFKKVSYKAIGKHVFKGYQQWLLQIGDKAPPWAHNLYESYSKNYLDYYLIEAFK